MPAGNYIHDANAMILDGPFGTKLNGVYPLHGYHKVPTAFSPLELGLCAKVALLGLDMYNNDDDDNNGNDNDIDKHNNKHKHNKPNNNHNNTNNNDHDNNPYYNYMFALSVLGILTMLGTENFCFALLLLSYYAIQYCDVT